MDSDNSEICSIIVGGRDKFSPTACCLEGIIEHTRPLHEIICVLGGAPENVKEDLTKRFGSKVRFIFKPEFLNQPQARNIGLPEAKGRFAIVMDNDVLVREGWLEPLLECQKETGATMVTPLVLEGEKVIHTGANELYITYKNGKAYGHKELQFHGMIFEDETNLKRRETDYGELHCQLVEVEPAIRLNAFDGNIQEVGECDSGLTWAKAGLKMYFEPKSVVYYVFKHPICAEDIRFFVWRWDMRSILKGYKYFDEKWGNDITEHGDFANFLLGYNKKIGILPRLFPYAFVLRFDQILGKTWSFVSKLFPRLLSPWRRFLAWRIGYYEWQDYIKDRY